MKAVISLGGSVVGFPPDIKWLRSFRDFVEEFKNDIVGIVVGGGPLARYMIDMATSLGSNKALLDMIGIEVTVLNAWIVRAALGELVEDKVEKYRISCKRGRIPVFGGTEYPGLTTDFAAALMAEYCRASFVNITRSGGIYTKDPAIYPDSELIRRTTYSELEKLIYRYDKREPGTHFPVDVAAFNILRRSGVRGYVVGPDIENLKRLFQGEEWTGTELVP